jgi:3-phenylpropionate/trans-cinnamate dioxygenase ferredoxin subunit
LSPALALLGILILGSWGVASIGLIAGGIILMFFAGDPTTASSGGIDAVGPWILLISGFISLGLAVMVTSPLLGLDPPIPIPASKIIPHSRMKRWERAGALADFPDGKPKEIRMRTIRVLIVRTGETAYAMGALCTHMRLPIGSFPGAPIKPYPVQDNCVTCPFHGARFDIETGRVVRQPWNSQFNNDHPFLGRLQSKLIPWPKRAEDIQTYPVNVENGEIFVMLPR